MTQEKHLCDVGTTGQNKFCACGHLKDHHVNYKGNLYCQAMVFNSDANKMMQCGCKI